VIIECPSCQSKYQYDEERFERKPSKKIRCAKCQKVFEIQNPAFATPAPAPAIEKLERTFTSKGDSTRTTKLPQETTDHSPLPKPDTDKQPMGLQLPPGKRLSLAVLDGSDAGTVYRIDKPRMTIGRANADIVLNDSESSRQHAAIEVRDTLYLLTDLGSTNGTLVDGQRITAPVELTDKSEFQIGTSTIMFIVTDEA